MECNCGICDNVDSLPFDSSPCTGNYETCGENEKLGEYECTEKCVVSDQFGDDIAVEVGTKWQLTKAENSMRVDSHMFDETDVTYAFLVDGEGKTVKVTDKELEKYFKEMKK